MHFSWFDILLLVSAFGFVWGGFWAGLIQSIGGVIGLFLGQFIASRYYENFAGVVSPVFGGNEVAGKIFAFILIFLFVTRVTGLAFFFVNKIFHFFAIVPGMKLVNKFGGAVFGFIEASLFIGISLQFLSRLPISVGLAETIKNSAIATYFLSITGWLVPLFPKILKDSQNAVDAILPKNIDVPSELNDAGKAINTYNSIRNTGLVK